MFYTFNAKVIGASAFAIAMAFASSAQAAVVVQGTVGDRIGSSFAGAFTDVRYVSGETGEFTMPATLVCVDLNGTFPKGGVRHTYTVSSTGLASVINTGASSRATDLFHYAIDQFYDSMVLREPAGRSTGFQFSSLMWEIEQDFNGQASSLNAQSGVMRAAKLKLADGGLAFQSMVAALHDNYGNIATGYRSSKYTIAFLDDEVNGYQNMMMLTPFVAAQVPEPGTLALGLIAGLAMLRRRPRARTAN